LSRILAAKSGKWRSPLQIITKPVGCWSLEKFGDGDALAADEELGAGMVGFIEGGDAGEEFHGVMEADG
jgi:hypothetical protein